MKPEEAAALVVDASILRDNEEDSGCFVGDVSMALIACFEELTPEQRWKVIDGLADKDTNLRNFITLDMLRNK